MLLATSSGVFLALTSVAAAVIGLLATFLVARLQRYTRISVGGLSARLQTVERSRKGAVVCDFVDAGTLLTLASQYGVEPRPEEVEKTAASKLGAGVEAGLTGLKGTASAEQSEAMRVLYRVRFDPHLLTEEVITAIERLDALRSDLDALPTVGLDELRSVSEAGTGLVEVERLWDAMVARGKAQQFAQVAASDDYVLIESEWRVVQSGSPGLVELELARLGSDSNRTEMPSGVSLHVPVLVGSNEEMGDAILTAQGRQRIRHGAQIRASVFGRVGSFDAAASRLSVIPICVFGRIGRRTAGRTHELPESVVAV